MAYIVQLLTHYLSCMYLFYRSQLLNVGLQAYSGRGRAAWPRRKLLYLTHSCGAATGWPCAAATSSSFVLSSSCLIVIAISVK